MQKTSGSTKVVMVLKRGVGNREFMGDVLDKANEEYWTNFWANQELPKEINPQDKSLASFANREFDQFYTSFFKEKFQHQTLIEIGCGNSVWLSYFHKQFGFDVSGLDYSELGCAQTKKILERDQVKGSIYLGDLFHPPSELIGKFDVVCSFGVVEHFDDTVATLNKIGAFLKPGGILITSIPNLTGVSGFLQKWMNRPVYDIHKVMSTEQIKNYVKDAGFEIIKAERLIPVSFGVTLEEMDQKKIKNKSFKKIILKAFQVLELGCRIINDKLFRLPKSELFCGGMIVAAKKTLS